MKCRFAKCEMNLCDLIKAWRRRFLWGLGKVVKFIEYFDTMLIESRFYSLNLSIQEFNEVCFEVFRGF